MNEYHKIIYDDILINVFLPRYCEIFSNYVDMQLVSWPIYINDCFNVKYITNAKSH